MTFRRKRCAGWAKCAFHTVNLDEASVTGEGLVVSAAPFSCDESRAQLTVVRTNDEWRALLRQAFGQDGEPPRIDFRNETVVATFAGRKPTGGYSVRVEKVTEESRAGQPSRVTIHYRLIAPGGCVSSSPYIVVRVKKKLDSIEFRPPIEVRLHNDSKD